VPPQVLQELLQELLQEQLLEPFPYDDF
jgi:hypothetical protein